MTIIESLNGSLTRLACPRCVGTGFIDDGQSRPSPTCSGNGDIVIDHLPHELVECRRCSGSGRLGKHRSDPVCAACFGSGVVTESGRPRIVTS